jgi:tetratricopeptide (TPR) repeat protein/transcriptional regulator with XRE-family HTH domain
MALSDSSDFGPLLRGKRLAAGLTQDELATRAALSVRTVSDLERGVSKPYPKTAARLAEALRLPPADLDAFTRASRAGRATDRSAPGQVRPRQLPAAPTDFTGRLAELTAMDALLGADGGEPGTVVVSAIGGTAGVGKTALALHWAHRSADRFPDGQLYINLRGYGPAEPLAAGDVLAAFLRALGVPGQDIPAPLDERAARYRSLMAGRRILTVLDNAASAEQVRPLLPGAITCAVLVTSRDMLAGLVARDGARRLDLDPLPPADAEGLLISRIGDRASADPVARATLAAQCARLPLALRVAAEFAAARPTTPLASLAAELADRQRRLDLLQAGGDPYTAVRAVFSWSYQHLDPETARLFRLTGLHPGAEFDDYAAAALAGAPLGATRSLLDRLVRAYLIQATETGRYSLHDLLRAYAAALADGEDGADQCRNALTRLLDYYVRTAAAATHTLFPGAREQQMPVPLLATPVPPVADKAAARQWLDTERDTLVLMAAHAADNGQPGHAIALQATVLRFLDQTGHFPEAIALASHALRAARQVGDRAAEAAALNGIGIMDFQQSRHDQAIDRLEQALALDRTAGGAASVARDLLNLAAVHMKLARFREATGYASEALDLYRQAGDRWGEAHVLQSLGIADLYQGRHQDAVEHQRQALALFAEVGDSSGAAQAHAYMGIVHLRQGRYQQAIDEHEQGLALDREVRNPSGEAHILRELSVVYLRQGDHERAATHLRRALELAREIGRPTAEAQARSLLGAVYLRQGRYQQAIDYQRQALARLREAGAWAHEGDALTALAETLLAAGQLGEARAEFTAAHELATRIGDTYQLARVLAGLGHVCQADGDPGQARRCWQQAATLYTDLGAPEADEVRAALAGQEPGTVRS